MSQTKDQQSRQDTQHGHQNQPKKGQNPKDSQNRQAEHSQKMGVDDIKEDRQRQGIGAPHDKKEKQEEKFANR